MGTRRGFVEAGAQNLLMTLWPMAVFGRPRKGHFNFFEMLLLGTPVEIRHSSGPNYVLSP